MLTPDYDTDYTAWTPARVAICLGAALLVGLLLLDPWPLLAAGRPQVAPKSTPDEPSIFAPIVPGTPAPREDTPGPQPPQIPSRPADPSPEICAKVREARNRLEYYGQQSLTQAQLERLAAEKELVHTRMGYRPLQVQALMASTYRDLEKGRRVVQDAKAAHDRLADDLIGKVETPWPACEAPKSR